MLMIYEQTARVFCTHDNTPRLLAIFIFCLCIGATRAIFTFRLLSTPLSALAILVLLLVLLLVQLLLVLYSCWQCQCVACMKSNSILGALVVLLLLTIFTNAPNHRADLVLLLLLPSLSETVCSWLRLQQCACVCGVVETGETTHTNALALAQCV